MKMLLDENMNLDEKKLEKLDIKFKYPIQKGRFNSMIGGKDKMTISDFKVVSV